jgi:pimeloyl-[acyl-carrier protein] methyl ester esterase
MVTLVLLPGLDGTGDLFEPFIAALGDDIRVRVVAYPPDERLNYAQLESVALAQLPPGEPLVLLGESFSGPIAVSLAAAHADRVRGLVMCCTFVSNPRPLLAPLEALTGAIPVRGVPGRILGRLLFGRYSTPALRSALDRALASVSPRVLRARLACVLGIDVSSRFATISAPILCLRASRDRLVPQVASSLILRLQPSARVHTYDAPHALLQALPLETARDVTAFVRDTA